MARWYPVDITLQPIGPVFQAPDKRTAQRLVRIACWDVRSVLDVKEDRAESEAEARRRKDEEGA